MSSQAARRAFKKLLRAEEQAFAGDLTTLRAAKVRTREAFRAPLASSTQEDEKAAVSHAHAVVSFLRQNLAQARRLPSKGKPGTSDDRYHIHIDPTRHELGDNETIRAGRKNKKKVPSPCNSSSGAEKEGGK